MPATSLRLELGAAAAGRELLAKFGEFLLEPPTLVDQRLDPLGQLVRGRP